MSGERRRESAHDGNGGGAMHSYTRNGYSLNLALSACSKKGCGLECIVYFKMALAVEFGKLNN